MKPINWNEEKNKWLRETRGISFEEIIVYIIENKIFKTTLHPNQKKYPGQKIFCIEINEYIFLVPYVEDDEKIFLKTIIPSRKATREYLRK